MGGRQHIFTFKGPVNKTLKGFIGSLEKLPMSQFSFSWPFGEFTPGQTWNRVIFRSIWEDFCCEFTWVPCSSSFILTITYSPVANPPPKKRSIGNEQHPYKAFNYTFYLLTMRPVNFKRRATFQLKGTNYQIRTQCAATQIGSPSRHATRPSCASDAGFMLQQKINMFCLYLSDIKLDLSAITINEAEPLL